MSPGPVRRLSRTPSGLRGRSRQRQAGQQHRRRRHRVDERDVLGRHCRGCHHHLEVLQPGLGVGRQGLPISGKVRAGTRRAMSMANRYLASGVVKIRQDASSDRSPASGRSARDARRERRDVRSSLDVRRCRRPLRVYPAVKRVGLGALLGRLGRPMSNSRPLSTNLPNTVVDGSRTLDVLEPERELGLGQHIRSQRPVQRRLERIVVIRQQQGQPETVQRPRANTVTPRFRSVITKRSSSRPPALTIAPRSTPGANSGQVAEARQGDCLGDHVQPPGQLRIAAPQADRDLGAAGQTEAADHRTGDARLAVDGHAQVQRIELDHAGDKLPALRRTEGETEFRQRKRRANRGPDANKSARSRTAPTAPPAKGPRTWPALAAAGSPDRRAR